jgi:hypothetical protein
VQRLLGALSKLEESLQSKDILLYHCDAAIEATLQKRGWGGEIVQDAPGDYLSVINTNINGYKTDAMIAESVDLRTEISADGTIIDTVSITRKHRGGNERFDWYNRVNADYLRVYVPKGSVLLSASGHTVEDYVPPVDYKNFAADPDVAAEESTIRIDPESKTKIFEESGKTVFGNWVYVSPQESVTVTYRYQLPFKVDFGAFTKTADVYSVLVQKQAGAPEFLPFHVTSYSRVELDELVERWLRRESGPSLPPAAAHGRFLEFVLSLEQWSSRAQLRRGVLEFVHEWVGGERLALMGADTARKELKIEAFVNHSTSSDFEIAKDILRVVLGGERGIHCADCSADFRFQRLSRQGDQPIGSFLAAPITSKGKYYGFLYADQPPGEAGFDAKALVQAYLAGALFGRLLHVMGMGKGR